MQGCPLAFTLLDEGRGTVGRKHLHTLRRASLRGQEERGPALVVPDIQIHQRFRQRLQGFTVTVVGLWATDNQLMTVLFLLCSGTQGSSKYTVSALFPDNSPAASQ